MNTKSEPLEIRKSAGAWLLWGIAGAVAGIALLALWLWGTNSAGYLIDMVAAYCF